MGGNPASRGVLSYPIAESNLLKANKYLAAELLAWDSFL